MQEKILSEKKKPDWKLNTGGISVTIWKDLKEKNGKNFSYYALRIERNFKNSNGDWQKTNSFRQKDIPNLIFLLNEAYRWLLTKDRSNEI